MIGYFRRFHSGLAQGVHISTTLLLRYNTDNMNYVYTIRV